MTQLDKIKTSIKLGAKTIQAILYQHPDIPRPSIRRILGEGAKKGIFKRLEKGVYTLETAEGETRAYIQLGKAEEVLPRMEAQGKKFDMVFLDPAYFSKALIGGNRGIKNYGFIHTMEFAIAMQSVYKMLRSDDSHVYLMLSGAATAQVDMNHYVMAALNTGLQLVAEGKYRKTFKDGSPVTNVRGDIASAERLLLLTRSGDYRQGELPEIDMDFTVVRPPVKGNYSTQKAEPFLNTIIQQSTFENESCLNPCAGSGIFEKCALMLNRIVTAVEVLEETIENFIVPKLQAFAI